MPSSTVFSPSWWIEWLFGYRILSSKHFPLRTLKVFFSFIKTSSNALILMCCICVPDTVLIHLYASADTFKWLANTARGSNMIVRWVDEWSETENVTYLNCSMFTTGVRSPASRWQRPCSLCSHLPYTSLWCFRLSLYSWSSSVFTSCV